MKSVSYQDFYNQVCNVPDSRVFAVKSLPDLIKEEGKEYMVSADVEIMYGKEIFCFIVAEKTNSGLHFVMDGKICNTFYNYRNSPVLDYLNRLSDFYDTEVLIDKRDLRNYAR